MTKSAARSPTKAAPRGPRPRTQPEINEYRRRALMDGAIQSMADYGVAGTTVQTICKAAGASRGLIGHYFESKEALIAAALKHLFDEVATEVRQAVEDAPQDDPVSQLKAVPSALFSAKVFNQRNRDAFLSFWHEVRFNAQVRAANRELYRGYIRRMEELYAAAAAERGRKIDAKRAALGFIALADGLWLGLSIHDQLLTPAQARDLCHLYIEEQLAGGR